MSYTLKELAKQLGADVHPADASAEIRGVASVESAKAGDLVFVEDAKWLDAAMKSGASAVVAGEFAKASSGKPMLIATQPKLIFTRAARLLMESEPRELGVHPTAVVHGTAKLGLGASVGAHAVIERGVVIGARTRIGCGAAIGANVQIGSECNIYPNVTVYANTTLGNRVVVHAGAVLGSDGFGYVRDSQTGKYEQFPQIGKLVIEDDVEIGANSTIDRGALDATVIKRGVKIDNLVHIGHNVSIGEDVVIAAQTGISGSSVIEKNTIIAGQVGIADHVTIEEGAILGAQSGIPTGKTIRGKGILFWGTPARPIKQYLTELAALARLAKK
jgi:UDP-3-O-[3-hydroxymyristoyl] glucosamine N-acyltransferase